MFKIILFIIGIFVFALFVLSMYVVIKPYALCVDTLCIFTGGNGSGKSFFSVHQSIVELRKLRLKVFLYNINPLRIIKRKPRKNKPILISNIPIRISFREMSTPLDFNPFVLQERLPEKCVVFIDEINLFLSQMDYKVTSEELLNEAITLIRHQTKGGKMIANTQNINKCHWVFRYCANRSYNLCEFKKPVLGLPILAWVKCRNISIGEDIKTVENENVEDGRRNLFAFFPLFRRYDTYVYSERYNPLPLYQRKSYTQLKRNSLMKLDVKKDYPVLIDNTDEFSCGGVRSEHVKPTLKKTFNPFSSLNVKEGVSTTACDISPQ